MTLTLTQAEMDAANVLQTVLNDAKTVLTGLASNPVTSEAENIVPGLAGIMSKVGEAGAIAGAAGAAIPAIELVLGLIETGVIKPADVTDPVFQRQGDDPYTDDMGNGDSGGN